MINTYTRDTSGIIRNDFLRFSSGTAAAPARRQVGLDADGQMVEHAETGSLEDLRAEMANDDGLGSFASYKSPVF